jgi:hypothetical protein
MKMAIFYREYVAGDHGHKYVCELPEKVAKAWIMEPPYYDEMASYMRGYSHCGEGSLMNKGALLVQASVDGSELWVYKHDFRWWLTTPGKEK